jgi:hypothetical protein
MGHVVLSYPTLNSSNFLIANTSPRIEFFRTATYATAAGAAQKTADVADRGGIVAGDMLYIGTNAFVTVAVSGSEAGTITFDTAITFSANDAVVVKRKTGASVDAYATVYSDPTYATAIATVPIVANSDNEVRCYIKPGRYGVRWSNSAGTTLDLDHDVAFDEIDCVQVTPQHDSPTAGISEAIKKLSSTGGTVSLGPGTYTITSQITFPAGSGNWRLVGAGSRLTTIKRADTANVSLLGVDIAHGNSFEIMGIGFNGNNGVNVANLTNPQLLNSTGVNNLTVHDCYFTRSIQTALNITGVNQSNNVIIRDNLFEDNGWGGVQINYVKNLTIERNSFITLGYTAIGVTSTVGDTSKRCDNVLIANNYVNKAATPTNILFGQVLDGFFTNLGYSTGVVVCGNIFYDNRNAGASSKDGLGTSGGLIDVVIANNIVTLAGAFGIDVGGTTDSSGPYVVVGNIVSNSATHGIVGPSDITPFWTQTIVADNIVIDVNEDASALDINGIDFRLNGATETLRELHITGNIVVDTRDRMNYGIFVSNNTGGVMDSVVISGNTVRKDGSTRASRVAGIYINCDGTSTIADLVIKDNILRSILGGGTVSSIRWGGSNLAGITNIRGLGTNITMASDPYSGLTYLTSTGLAGGVAAGTRNVVNANWPNIALLFEASRVAHNSAQSSALGHLAATYVGATSTLTLSTNTAADAAETGDASGVRWACLGTVVAVAGS